MIAVLPDEEPAADTTLSSGITPVIFITAIPSRYSALSPVPVIITRSEAVLLIIGSTATPTRFLSPSVVKLIPAFAYSLLPASI